MVVSKYISAMRTKRFYRPELRASYFSMIELMLVLVVASIVLGITMRPKPAQVDVGVQMISRQIRLAQQYAITKRQRVALLLPQANMGTGLDESLYTNKSFRACLVTFDGTDYSFSSHIAGTKWGFLPPKMSLSLADSGDFKTVENVENSIGGLPYSANVKAIVFEPTGALVNGSDVTLSVTADAEADNHVDCTISWISGRVKIQ